LDLLTLSWTSLEFSTRFRLVWFVYLLSAAACAPHFEVLTTISCRQILDLVSRISPCLPCLPHYVSKSSCLHYLPQSLLSSASLNPSFCIFYCRLVLSTTACLCHLSVSLLIIHIYHITPPPCTPWRLCLIAVVSILSLKNCSIALEHQFL
jgi:hypothetical protein